MRNREQTTKRVLLALSTVVLASALDPVLAQSPNPARSSDRRATAAADAEVHRAAREGDLVALRARLQAGADPDQLDRNGRTALLDAAKAGQSEAIRLLLAAGARVNGAPAAGRSPLVEAAQQGERDAARVLLDAGADLNVVQRGAGTALEVAERNGHTELASMLRQAGARTLGRSVGDAVCVRPWNGEGYCGVVQAINRTAYTIRISRLVGCEGRCPAKTECSEAKPVGGSDGLRPADTVTTASWCLTDTGVKP